MCMVIIGSESFDSENIKIVKRTKIGDGYAVQIYIDTENGCGKLFEVPFSDLLKKDSNISRLAYDYILNCLKHKQSGNIDLELMMLSLAKLYRSTLQIYAKTGIDMNNLQQLRDNIMHDYFQALNRLSRSLY